MFNKNLKIMTKNEIKLVNYATAYILHQFNIDNLFTRKPGALSEVENTFDLNTISGPYDYDRKMISDVICSLPLIKYVNTEDGIKNNYDSFQPFDNVDFKGYQFALLACDDGTIYLIDNQGHRYCRYMVCLTNLNTTEMLNIYNRKDVINLFYLGKYLYKYKTTTDVVNDISENKE